MTEHIDEPIGQPFENYRGMPAERPHLAVGLLPDQLPRSWANLVGDANGGQLGFATQIAGQDGAGAADATGISFQHRRIPSDPTGTFPTRPLISHRTAGDTLYFDAQVHIALPEHPPNAPLLLPVYAGQPSGTAFIPQKLTASTLVTSAGPLYPVHFAPAPAPEVSRPLVDCSAASFRAASPPRPASMPPRGISRGSGRFLIPPSSPTATQLEQTPRHPAHLSIPTPHHCGDGPVGMADGLSIMRSQDEEPADHLQQGIQRGSESRQLVSFRREENPLSRSLTVAYAAAAEAGSYPSRNKPSVSSPEKRPLVKETVVAPPLSLLKHTTLRLVKSREDLAPDIQSTGSRTEDEDWSRWKEPFMPVRGFFGQEPADQLPHDGMMAQAATTDVETSSGQNSVVEISDDGNESEDMSSDSGTVQVDGDIQDLEAKERQLPTRAPSVMDFSKLDCDTLRRYQEVFEIAVPKAKGYTGSAPTHEQLAFLAAEHFKKMQVMPGGNGESSPHRQECGEATEVERCILDLFVEKIESDREARRKRTHHKGWRRRQTVNLEDINMLDVSSDESEDCSQRRYPITRRLPPSAGFLPATFHRTGARRRREGDGLQNEPDTKGTGRMQRVSGLREDSRRSPRRGRPRKAASTPVAGICASHAVVRSSPLKRSTVLSPTPSPPPSRRTVKRMQESSRKVVDCSPPPRLTIMSSHTARTSAPPACMPKKAEIIRKSAGSPHSSMQPRSRRTHPERYVPVKGGTKRVDRPRPSLPKAKSKELKPGESRLVTEATGGEIDRSPHKYSLSDSGSLRGTISPSPLTPPPPPPRKESRPFFRSRRLLSHSPPRRKYRAFREDQHTIYSPCVQPDLYYTECYSPDRAGRQALRRNDAASYQALYDQRFCQPLHLNPRDSESRSEGVIFVPGMAHGLHPGKR